MSEEKNNNNKKSIFLFYGEDSFSSNEKLKTWKKEFIKKHGEECLETIDGKQLQSNEFITNIEALPFSNA